MRWRAGESDRHVLHQVFASREYDLTRFPQWDLLERRYDEIHERNKRPLIIDAGANIGASAIWFAEQFPDAQVACIEPDHINANLCRENTREIRQIEVWQQAVGGSNGYVNISNPQDEPFARRVYRENKGEIGLITIRGIEDIYPDTDLFIVKMDIEGFEEDVFYDTDVSWIDRATCLIIEPHDWLIPGSSRFLQEVMGRKDFDLLISGENLIYVNRDMAP